MSKDKITHGSFSERVVKVAMAIPKGRVTTYGRIAQAAGGRGPMSAQSVTGILARASREGVKNIPYHRIVYASGQAWMSPEYRDLRLELYKREGIKLDDNDKIINFKQVLI
jgi:methylated-DNA-protein-cysteine methyltransferase-like protein